MNETINLINRTDDQQKIAEAMFEVMRADLLKRQLSNNENHDKTLLTLSSVGLGASFSFFKFFDKDNILDPCLLKISWSFFLLSIFASIVAYHISNTAINKELILGDEYYNKKNALVDINNNIWKKINYILNISTGSLFSVALLFLTLFLNQNLTKEKDSMSTKVKITNNQSLDGSASIPTIQQAPSSGHGERRSANIPTMQVAPSSPPTSQQGQQTGGQPQPIISNPSTTQEK